ncbi:MAG TPA: hypothetical protein PLL69_09405 [Gemmatimonadales bacterium]|nr:hypothetical protein [Gemmatimonadales bacterium]
MDPAVELTLRLIRAGQEALNPMSSLSGWVLFPSLKQLQWREARDMLSSVPKPVIVAALVEPGAVALWSAPELTPEGRRSLDAQIRNQRDNFEAMISAIGLDPSDEIETPDQGFRLSVTDFRRWTQDYCISVIGLSLAASSTPRTGRLQVRRPGGHQPPVGWMDAAE